MYEKFFELRRRPFASTPDIASYYPAPSHEQALAILRGCVETGESLAVLLGDIGTGKTLLAHLLLDLLGPDCSTVFITNIHTPSVEAFLQAVLYDLALPFESLSEQQMRLALTDYLLEKFSQGNPTLLLVDEAQNLSLEQLEEIRMLSNLEGRREKAVQIILFGQPPLGETLLRPPLAGLRQRFAAVARLQPLEADSTNEYIRTQLASAGGNVDSIFTAAALSEIFDQSRGIPRLINQLCHNALLAALMRQSGTVDVAEVDEAVARTLLVPYQPAVTEDLHHSNLSINEQPGRYEVTEEPLELDSLGPTVVEVGAGCAPHDGQRESQASMHLLAPTASNGEEAQASPLPSGRSVSLPERRIPTRLRQLYSR